MSTAANLKRKNIDLPVETLQRLSLLAVAQGRSLKNYIENLLIAKAEGVRIEIHENPSPSGDPWFDNPENLAMVSESLAQYKKGDSVKMSLEEIKKQLDL